MLVYPNTVGRSYVVWLGQSLLQRLTEKGLIEDGQIVEAAQHRLPRFPTGGRERRDEELIREALRWERDTIGTGMSHPDMWPGIIVRDLADAGARNWRRLGAIRWAGPTATAIASCAASPTLIRDRLKQYPTIGKIDEIGTQDEAIYLYYSSRRFSALDLSPQTVAARLQRRNINLPGGRVETPQAKRRRAAQRRVQERAGVGRGGDRRPGRTIPPTSATWSISSAATKTRRA